MDAQERKQKLVSAGMEVEVEQALKHVPDSGSFSPTWVQLSKYAAGYDAYLRIEHSTEHGCAIRASVNPQGTDLEISNYMFFGSKQDCISWLKDGAHMEKLLKTYDHLVQKADNRD